MPTVDSLDIQISAQAQNAEKALNSLSDKLNTLSASLKGLNGSGLTGLANGVSNNVIQMTNALANLASQGSRVGTSTNTLVSGLNRTNKASIRATKSATSLAAAFGKFYANFFLLVRGIKGLWNSIEGTADYIEAYNYFNVALGKIGSDWSYQFEQYGYDSAEAYADSFATRLQQKLSGLSGITISINEEGSGLLTESGLQNLGLNIKEVTQYASQLASVTNSVGQTGEVSLVTASAFTKLGADISSLFNIDYADVMGNLQSGLIGQSRALYKYGIDITNATLQTYAYELGLEKAVSEMTQAEKMQLRMLAILDQSKVSWGDLANTIDSPSNMIRQLTNNLQEAGMVLGQLFIPLLQKVLPIINGVTIAIKRLLTSIATILGIEIDLKGFGQGYSGMEDDVDGLTDSLDDATDSANKLNKQLGKFDELNNLTTSSTTSGTDVTIGGTIDLTDEILKATEKYEKAWNESFSNMENTAQEWADKIYIVFSEIVSSAEPFINSIRELWNGGLKELFSFTWEGLKGFYENFLVPIGEWAFEEENSGLTRLVNIVNEGLERIDWDSLIQSLNDFWNALEPYAEEFGEGLIDFFTGLSGIAIDILNKVPDFLKALTEALEDGDPEDARKWGENLLILLAGIKGFSIASKVAAGITTVAGALKKIISIKDSAKIATIGKNLKGIAGALKGFGTTVSGALSSLGGVGGLFTTDLSTIFGAGTFAEIGLTVATGLVGVIAAAIGGWNIGQILYEWITGEEIDMKWTEQFSKIFESFTDGSWKGALDLWGQDIASAFKTAGEEIGKWYNNNVSPTFENAGKTITEFGKTYISEPFRLWGEDIEKWWTDDVSPWFTKDKWNEFGENVKNGISSKWSEFSEWWSNTGLYKWWNEEVAPYFDKEKWSWEGIKEGLSQAFENAIASVKKIWNGFATWINDALTFEIQGISKDLGVLGKLEIPPFTIDLGKLPTFATGGFPSVGDLFIANEAGPELVGTMNGKPAVVGNNEISGISNAIYSTSSEELALLKQQNQLLQAILEKDFGISDNYIGKASQRYAEEYYKRTNRQAYSF